MYEAENYMTFLLGEARKEVQAVESMEKQVEEGQEAGAPEEEVKVRGNSRLCPILYHPDRSVTPLHRQCRPEILFSSCADA